jgi:hypothetical protein
MACQIRRALSGQYLKQSREFRWTRGGSWGPALIHRVYLSPVKPILWMLILFWAAIFLLNVRAVHAIQQWIFSVRSVYIIMLLPASLFLCISTLRAIDNYRRKHPFIYGLLAFVAAVYGAYATLLSGDPIDPLRGYIRPEQEQVFEVLLGLLFTLSGIVGQMRAAPESANKSPRPRSRLLNENRARKPDFSASVTSVATNSLYRSRRINRRSWPVRPDDAVSEPKATE